ncbi:hypothetical protein HY490_02220, partial [Candidatus Woesearchaeota archaeon]|nr:hypothetical protein [Candidatus Woesearchaeota archaeon]
FSSASIQGQKRAGNNTFALKKLNYTLFAEIYTGGLSVSAGQTVRSRHALKEGFLTPAWDMVYLGLSDPGQSYVVLDPNGDHSYNLQFTNQEGIFYDVPFMTTDGTGSRLKFGDKDDDLWFCESANSSTYQVTQNDFFVLSNCDGPAQDNTCNSHVLRYDKADTTNHRLTFVDLGTGKREVVFDNATREAVIVAAGVQYTAFVDPLSPHNLSIDFSGNGDVAGECAYIGLMGDGMLALGRNNTNQSGGQGPKAFVANNSNNLTILTILSDFDEADQIENLSIELEARAGDVIGVPKNGIRTPEGGMFGPLTLSHNTQLDVALTLYGLWVERFDPSGDTDAETVTVAYPFEQVGAEVYVTESPFTEMTTDKELTERIHPITQPLSTLAGEVADISKYNSIVVGGPCANAVAAQLLGNPAPCTTPFLDAPGMLKLFSHDNGNVALLVAGLTADQTRATSNVLLIYGKDYNVTDAKLSRPTLADAFVRRT